MSSGVTQLCLRGVPSEVPRGHSGRLSQVAVGGYLRAFQMVTLHILVLRGNYASSIFVIVYLTDLAAFKAQYRKSDLAKHWSLS